MENRAKCPVHAKNQPEKVGKEEKNEKGMRKTKTTKKKEKKDNDQINRTPCQY